MRAAIVLLALVAAGCASHYNEEPAVRPVHSTLVYDRPILSPGEQFSGLPPVVQNTVRAQAGAAEIVALLKQTNVSLVVYKFYFRNPEVNPPLMVAQDGSVLNPDYSVAVGAPRETIGVGTGGLVQGLRLSDLPPSVVKTIQDRAPAAEVASIRKEMADDQTTFVISFKEETRNPPLRIRADGSLVSELPEDASGKD